MQIINIYHKRLTWDSKDFVFTIDANEIKNAPDEIAVKLLISPHIKKVQKEVHKKVKEIEPIFSGKTRKSKRS